MTESWGLTIGVAIVAGAWLGPPALIVVGAGVIVLQVLRQQRNLAILAVTLGCTLLGVGRMALADVSQAPDQVAASTGATIVVESLPRPSRGGVTATARITELAFDDRTAPVDPFLVLISLPEGDVATPGDVVRVVWSVEAVDSVEPGYGQYLRSQGVSVVGRAWWVETERGGPAFFNALVQVRAEIVDGLLDALPGDAGALAAGIVTGDDSRLSEAVRDAFLKTGTTHITAVSGSNVAMVLAIWNLVVPAGRNRRLLAVQVLIIASIWLYAILVGLEPPAMRAALMASLVLLGSRFGRRPDLLTLLALTSAAMVLWNPQNVRMVAFWLSVIASAAIIMRVPNTHDGSWKPKVRGVIEGVGLAQIATLPIILATFGTWSLTSVVANTLLTPLMWLAFPFCFLLAGIVLAIPAIAPFAAIPPLILLEVSLQVVQALGTMMPLLDFNNAGLAGILAVSIPCLIGFAMLSQDTRRWSDAVARRWQENPILVATTLIGPSLGLLVAAVLRAHGE